MKTRGKPASRRSLARAYVDWDDLDFKKTSKTERQELIRKVLYPLAEEYSTPVPSVFLHHLVSLAPILKSEVTIARDGAIPLLRFYHQFKTPKRIFTKIAVHEDLLPIVPPAWQPVTASYRLVSLKQAAPVKAVFMYGSNTSALVSPASCEKALKASSKQIARASKLYLHLPSYFLSSEEPYQFHVDIARRIFEIVGTDVEIIDWGRFLMNRDLTGCHVISLMKNTLISDCWLTHTLMSLGASLKSERGAPHEQIYELSRSHGVAIRLKPRFPNVPPDQRSRRERTLLSSYEMAVFRGPMSLLRAATGSH